MTAQARAEDREATLLAGMTSHLSKPIEEQLLYQTLVDVFSKTGDVERKAAHSAEPMIGTTNIVPYALRQPGPVDFDAALHRMGGSRERMQRLLHGFIRDFAEMPQRLDTAVAARNSKNLQELAHLVKGAAGYVQAKALTHSADALERQASRADAALIERLAFTLRTDLTAVLGAIGDHVKRQADAAAKQLPVIGGDTTKALELMDMAEPLMRKGDYAAASLLADLALELRDHSVAGQLEEVRVLYEDIELDQALTALQQLRQLLRSAADAVGRD